MVDEKRDVMHLYYLATGDFKIVNKSYRKSMKITSFTRYIMYNLQSSIAVLNCWKDMELYKYNWILLGEGVDDRMHRDIMDNDWTMRWL